MDSTVGQPGQVQTRSSKPDQGHEQGSLVVHADRPLRLIHVLSSFCVSSSFSFSRLLDSSLSIAVEISLPLSPHFSFSAALVFSLSYPLSFTLSLAVITAPIFLISRYPSILQSPSLSLHFSLSALLLSLSLSPFISHSQSSLSVSLSILYHYPLRHRRSCFIYHYYLRISVLSHLVVTRRTCTYTSCILSLMYLSVYIANTLPLSSPYLQCDLTQTECRFTKSRRSRFFFSSNTSLRSRRYLSLVLAVTCTLELTQSKTLSGLAMMR